MDRYLELKKNLLSGYLVNPENDHEIDLINQISNEHDVKSIFLSHKNII